MSLKGFTRNIKPLEILTEEQLDIIHKSTLEILENVGLRFESEKILKIFKKNDCNVDSENNRVRIPSYIVEEMLRKCPSSFTVKSRSAKHRLRIGGNTLYFSNMPGKGIVTIENWIIRKATKKENKEALIVLDSLENLHLLCSYTPYFEIEGISPIMSIPESVAAKIRYSTKVQLTGYQKGCEQFIIELAKATNQDIIGIVLPSSPLTYYSEACEAAIRYTQAGFPINIGSSPIMGGTSPVTIGGALVAFNAEVIGGIVLVQMVNPGARVMVEDGAMPMNMRSGSPIFGNITSCLHIAAAGQIWKKYEIPMFADTGWANSKKIDYQSGYEKSISTFVMALAGCNGTFFHGGLYGELAYHPLQSIIDDDIAGMVGKFIEGLQINHETLALDIIEDAGPIPGYFLNKNHTRKHFKEEVYLPKSADLLTYHEWRNNRQKDVIIHAEEKFYEILKNHKVEPLADEQNKEVKKILNKAREFYKNK